MPIQIYDTTNSAWSDITSPKVYANSAWEEPTAINAYENDAWVEKWPEVKEAVFTLSSSSVDTATYTPQGSLCKLRIDETYSTSSASLRVSCQFNEIILKGTNISVSTICNLFITDGEGRFAISYSNSSNALRSSYVWHQDLTASKSNVTIDRSVSAILDFDTISFSIHTYDYYMYMQWVLTSEVSLSIGGKQYNVTFE